MQTEVEHLRLVNLILRQQINWVFDSENSVLRKIYLELKKDKYKDDYKELKSMVEKHVREFDLKLSKIKKETEEELDKVKKEKRK